MRLDDVLRPQSETSNEASNEEPTSDPPPDRPAPAPINRLLTPEGEYPARSLEATAPRAPAASSRNPARNLPFNTLGWHSTVSTEVKRPLWQSMPTFNQFLTVCGGACLLLALLRVAGPPIAESARLAYRPYTAEGKQELCQTHLRAVAQALAAYAQDNDGRYPPLDYQNPQGQRVTWVSLVREGLTDEDLRCPLGHNLPDGAEHLTCSFVLNPVLATVRASDMDDPSATVLLADGGPKHDVSLLPPYPTWPSYGARRGGSIQGKRTTSRIESDCV